MTGYDGVWRDPPDETVDMYPGLVVADNRVTGSITIGVSRLPMWALAWYSYDDAVFAYPQLDEYGWTGQRHHEFLHDLLEARGEFARLLLTLADAERCDRLKPSGGVGWWRTRRHRKRVGDQLRRCLATLEGDDQ